MPDGGCMCVVGEGCDACGKHQAKAEAADSFRLRIGLRTFVELWATE